jgi:methylated-DNA-[protein]-cysteine S-methyltransferase
MTRPMIAFAIFPTAAGSCAVAWSDRGIVRFQLPVRDAAAAERLLRRRLPDAVPGTPPAAVDRAIAAVRSYFAGRPADFADVALDLGDQEPFFDRVYAAARGIPWGATTTYGALARDLGAPPEAARDVGQAMARNPVPLFIPCHRVLAAGGKVGGFSAPGGAAAKRRMLALEGVDLAPPAPAQAAFSF